MRFTQSSFESVMLSSTKFARKIMAFAKMCTDVVHSTAVAGYNKNVVNFYERARPGYNRTAVELILKNLGALDHNEDNDFVILELGAGTGKFTRDMVGVLGNRRVRIVATEPLPTMCEKFREVLPDIEVREGVAEKIDLPDASVHAVVAAQCFHWFENAESVAEIHRVLVPNGKFGLLWNTRDRSVAWVDEMDSIIFPNYTRFNTPTQRSKNWKKVLESSGKFDRLGLDNSLRTLQTLPADKFMERIMSISVIELCSAEEKDAMFSQIKAILGKHRAANDKGEVTLPHVVEIYWYCKR